MMDGSRAGADERRLRWLGWGLLAVGMLLVAWWGISCFVTARSLLAHLETAQALAEEASVESLMEEPEVAGRLIHGVREDVVRLQWLAGGLVRLAPAFGWLPEVGPVLAEAPDLLIMADGLTEVGVLAWDGAAPALEAWGEGGEDGVQELALALDELEPVIPQARAALARASEAREGVEVDALPWRLRAPMARLDEALPLLERGLALAEVAPALLGVEEPRTYLILVQNEDELRPTGGFITGVGEVTVDGGELVGMTFSDSYTADDFTQPYPDPPVPLQRFLGADLWVFRDSNWSPDFPTSVEQALELYRPEHPVRVDGVVAVDQWAARELIDAVGPLWLEGAEEGVTGENFMAYVREAWAPDDGSLDREWWRQRKDFMADVADAALAKVLAGNVDFSMALETLLRALDEKHILLYFEEAEVMEALREQGWTGEVGSPKGDYVMVAEANLGYNKASARIARHLDYAVDLSQSPPEVHLTLTYTHTANVDYPCRPEVRYDLVYTEMMNRCYWGYLQVYLPEGVTLRDSSDHPIPAEAMWDGEPWEGSALVKEGHGHTVVEQAFLLPPGESTEVRFRYALPQGILDQRGHGVSYHLTVQKQPGLDRLPLSLRLPSDAVLLDVSPPEPIVKTDGMLRYGGDVRGDLSIQVRYSEVAP